MDFWIRRRQLPLTAVEGIASVGYGRRVTLVVQVAAVSAASSRELVVHPDHVAAAVVELTTVDDQATACCLRRSPSRAQAAPLLANYPF